MSAWTRAEAESAFGRATRGRVRASLPGLARRCRDCLKLPVHDGPLASGRPQRREIPLDAITGTLEPNRAAEFDSSFRPARSARARWERIWMAEQRGVVLPPISVVQTCCQYVVRDGHHRVSVAKARGALTIDAIVAA